ncbi:hypothetical protein ACIPJG_32535 [Streptomyces halstedii]|uniref:hypothetical protein n=1 Tax=Streptomyces halstedii TaxID=1944 RepID=UPI00381FB7F7
MSDARSQIVGLIAGSDDIIRPIAERVADSILAVHAHELAEKIRTQKKTLVGCSEWLDGMDDAADLIDPEVETS